MKFLKHGNAWSLTPNARLDVRDVLPAGNYTICKNPQSGEYFLEESESFSLPKKLYGKIQRHGERILASFKTRQADSQVGVFLSGTKGSGKTLLSKYISNHSGLPVIIVNAPYTDDRFMRTIQGITQPAVVLFDEFEKLYDQEEQESILTLFDGVYTAQNKIMIITCNDKWAVREFFHNRPSRLRYSINFEGLDAEFVEEYCADQLQDGKYLKSILTLLGATEEFNFDMLQTLVDELNRWGGDFEETLEILNVKPVATSRSKWTLSVATPDEPSTKWKLTYGETISRNPLTYMQVGKHGHGCLEVGVKQIGDDDDDDHDEIDLGLRNEHLYKVDPMNGTTVLKLTQRGHNFVVTIKEERLGNGWGIFNRDAF
jgi:hypothetical protein